MTKRIAVIGTGYWGRSLVRVFNEIGVLAAICDIDADKLKAYSTDYPKIRTFVSPDILLKSDYIDAVVIATPVSTHYELAKNALISGRDVFVEKPLSLSIEEGEELASLSKASGRTLMVGHILNYHPAVTKLKELIDKGELGKIEYIYSNRLNIGKLRTEENILWSFAPHDISAILMLLGEFPQQVMSFGGKYLQKDIYDTTLTTLTFANGVKAHIFVSWLHPFKEQRLVVVGSNKMAVFDDVSEEKLYIYPHSVKWQNRTPVAEKARPKAVQVDKDEPLKLECRHFLECIEKRQRPLTDAEEGMRVLRILAASEESLRQDGKPVFLNRSRGGRGYFVHHSSFVDDGVEIGEGTQIWHFCHILKGSRIGRNCRLGQNVVIGPDVSIGDGCKIQNNVSIYKGVILQDSVFCGPSCVFTNVINPRSGISRMDELKPTLVKKGATVGANAAIVCGNTIGSYAFVGAGAVVTKDIPDFALVYGNPARQAGWMCECGVKLDLKNNTAICKVCKKRYKKIKNLLCRIAGSDKLTEA